MEPPVQPLESDCCNSCCNPCILDVYEAQLKKYNDYIKKVGKSAANGSEIINAINPMVYTIYELINRKSVSKTVVLLTFRYADSGVKVPNCLAYKSGQYFMLRAKDCEGEFTRAYTPIPMSDDGLLFTVLVRLYDCGRMSNLLKNLQIGHKSSWRGPYGDFVVNYSYKYLFFIAQGTGVAPIYSIIDEIVHNEDCECFIKLFFCCRDCEDILLRDELYKLGSFWNFTYEIFLSTNTSVVRRYNEIVHDNKLNIGNIRDYVDGKSGKLQAIVCGSQNFSENMQSMIESSGIESKHIYVF